MHCIGTIKKENIGLTSQAAKVIVVTHFSETFMPGLFALRRYSSGAKHRFNIQEGEERGCFPCFRNVEGRSS